MAEQVNGTQVTATTDVAGGTGGAVGTTATVATANGTTKPVEANDELFNKLDEILAKRATGIIKSVLKDNGVEDDANIKEIVANYNAKRMSEKNQSNDAINALKNENETLKKQIFDGQLKSTATKVATELQVNPTKIDYVMKLANLSNATKDGKIDEVELKKAIENVIKDVPEFKESGNGGTTGVRKFGANGSTTEPDDEMEKLRKAFGLKPIQK